MNLKVKVLSPVHIGNGNIISPYTDFVYKDNCLLYIDNQKLWSDISKNEKIIDEYVGVIKNKDLSSKEKYTLEDFLKRNNIDIDKYIYEKVNCYGDIKAVEINEVVKTSGRPYIPGSSLKGAIRTALLYNYLKINGFNLDDIIKMSTKSKRWNTYVGQDVMRKMPQNIQSDIMKYLYISDTEYTNMNDVSVNIEYCIDYTDVKEFNKLKVKMPIGIETINPGTVLNFSIKVAQQNKFFKDETNILSGVKSFYKDIIEHHIKIMENSNEKIFSNVISKYTDYLNSDSCIMRIGSNKNFYDNTICNLFTPDEVRGKIAEVSYKPFPKTDWFILDNQEEYIKESLGWIEIM